MYKSWSADLSFLLGERYFANVFGPLSLSTLVNVAPKREKMRKPR